MKASYLAPDALIAINKIEEPKIYIREQFGKFQKVRRYLSWCLMLLFIALPLLRYQGQQAILFDVGQQTLQIFSLILFPQDLFIFSLVFAIAAFGLFYLTRVYGRVWCGFACPQTIWLLMFNWLERRVEGSANQSRRLDKAKLTPSKIAKKVMKHTLWFSVSLLTGLVFMSYFIPVEQLYVDFFLLDASSLISGWVIFFALCTYVNAGWIKEKMCQHMCPYARFQSAMFNATTKLVSYDATRGESRGMRKRNQAKPEGLGDCIDCKLCVEVCPAGIDIRDGLQYECINCGLCIDACDQTMDKFGYQLGLISFQQEKPATSWRQHLTYGGIILALVGVMAGWVASWQSIDANILRDRNALYRVNGQGKIENTYLVKIRNKSSQVQQMAIELGESDIVLADKYQVSLAPKELKIVPVVAVQTGVVDGQRVDIDFTIRTDTEALTKEVSFYSGEGAW